MGTCFSGAFVHPVVLQVLPTQSGDAHLGRELYGLALERRPEQLRHDGGLEPAQLRLGGVHEGVDAL